MPVCLLETAVEPVNGDPDTHECAEKIEFGNQTLKYVELIMLAAWEANPLYIMNFETHTYPAYVSGFAMANPINRPYLTGMLLVMYQVLYLQVNASLTLNAAEVLSNLDTGRSI